MFSAPGTAAQLCRGVSVGQRGWEQLPWGGSGRRPCCAGRDPEPCRTALGPSPEAPVVSEVQMSISAVQLNSRVNSSLFKQSCLRSRFGIPSLGKIGKLILCVFYTILEWEAWGLLTCPRKAVLSEGAKSYPNLGSRKLKYSAFNQTIANVTSCIL